MPRKVRRVRRIISPEQYVRLTDSYEIEPYFNSRGTHAWVYKIWPIRVLFFTEKCESQIII